MSAPRAFGSDDQAACVTSVDGGFTDVRMHKPILRWVNLTPNAPAITDLEGSWTYQQFYDAVVLASAWLKERGVRSGDRVMLVGENGRSMAAFIFAASTLDASVVLENARRAPLEVARIREHADPRLVVYLFQGSSDALAHAKQAGARTEDAGVLGVVATDRLNFAAVPDVLTYTSEDVAALIYTTGTTGAPKGVMVRHASLLYLSETIGALRAFTSDDRMYCVLPITHIMGLAVVLGATLRAGAHLFLIARFDVTACARMLAEDGITMLQGAPAMFAKLLQHGGKYPLASPQLRFIAMGGAPVDPSLKESCEKVFGLALHNGYGLTESPCLCATRLDNPRSDTSVGPPLPGVSVRIMGENGKVVEEGGIGELWVHAPQIMKGYYREPAMTSRVLTEDGWFNTEDLATVDSTGNVQIVGRTKDMIASNGFKVYPLEVEDALNAHPDIVHSAVVGRGSIGSEDVVAFVELAADGKIEIEQLKKIFTERISPYKKPCEIYAMASLPSSPNGKVLKGHLRNMLADGSVRDLTRIL